MSPTQLRRSIRLAFASVLTASAVALSGCTLFEQQPAGTGGTAAPGQAGGQLTIQHTNFAHIDPQSVTFGMWLVQMGLLEGLVTQTPDGTGVRPGVAERWEQSPDGLTHTFHLRNGATWSNGDPLVAADFLATYKRLLDPTRGPGGVTTEASSYQAALGIKNATAFTAGTVTNFDDVGIKAPDEHTVVFTLGAPNPGFLLGLTHPSMLVLNPKGLEGNAWQRPETWVGNGPYNLAAWTPNSSMRLEKNPRYWDAANVTVQTVNVRLLEQGSTVTTVPFENGEVDIQPLANPADITRFTRDPNLNKRVKMVKNSGTTYLSVLHSKNKIMENPKVRSAINLALGREEVAGINELTEPASTLVSPLVPNFDADKLSAHKPMWGQGAIDKARSLLAEAGYPNGQGFPALSLLAGSNFDQLDVIVDRLKTNLNIEVKKDVVEVGVYVTRRAQVHDENYAGLWYGSFSGLSSWPAQTMTLWGSDLVRQAALPVEAYQEYLTVRDDKQMPAAERSRRLEEIMATKGNPDAQAFANKLKEATQTTDAAQQERLLADAASLREKTEVYMPLVWNSSAYIAQPRVEGLSLRASAERYYLKDLRINENAR